MNHGIFALVPDSFDQLFEKRSRESTEGLGEIISPEATGSARFAPKISGCSMTGSITAQVNSVEKSRSPRSPSGSPMVAVITASRPRIRAAQDNGAHWVVRAMVFLPMASATMCWERIILCIVGLAMTFCILSV